MKKSNSLLETFLRRRFAIRVFPLEKHTNKPWLARQLLKWGYDSIERAGAGGQGDQMTVSSKQKTVSGKTTERGSLRLFVLLCVLATVFLPAVSGAQQTGKIFRVGYLDPSTASSSAVLVKAFRQELSNHPVTAGFVESLARPGGNVTGITILTTELSGKRLELLKEVIPKLTRVAVLYEPTAPGITREVKEDLPVATRALG